MSGYIGTQPVPQATQTRDIFTATAGQTSFATGGYTPQFLDVYLNGVHLQNGTDYTASNGSDVVLTTGAAADDVLEVVAYTTFELLNPTFSGTVTADGLTVDTDTLHVDSTNNRVGIGTSSPQEKLHVNGSAKLDFGSAGGNPRLYFDHDTVTDDANFIQLNRGDAGLEIISEDNLKFDTNGSEAMRIDASGRVSLAALGELRLQTGSVTMDCTPTAGATDSFVWNTSLSVPYVWKQAGSERMRIDSGGRVTMPYQPCFSASAAGANLTWSAGSTIIKQVNLTYIPVNVGGHFSDTTNRFTAPVAGNYYFSAKATQTGAASGPSMLFYKNGVGFGYEASIGYGVAYHSFTGSTIMSLAAGDYVDLRIRNNNNVALTIDGSRTTFSGFLIG